MFNNAINMILLDVCKILQTEIRLCVFVCVMHTNETVFPT